MKTKISRLEIFWIIVASVIGLVGIVLALLGVIADFLPVRASDNFLAGSDAYFEGIFGVPFVWAGTILVIVAALVSAIFLCYYANKADKDKERDIRRAQRQRLLDEETPAVEGASAESAASSSNPS